MDTAGRAAVRAQANAGGPSGNAFEKVFSAKAEASTCATEHPALGTDPALSRPDSPLHDFAKWQVTL